MTADSEQAFAEFLNQLETIRLREPAVPNIFKIGGLGYLENPVSDLMAVFMGRGRHCPPWLTRALVSCLVTRGFADPSLLTDTDWESVEVERECAHRDDSSETYKRLDLLVSTDTFVLGIENKVLSGAGNNPFAVYDRLIDSRMASRTSLRCVVRPTARNDDVPSTWPVVSFAELVEGALGRFGAEQQRSTFSKWHVFYLEFLQHLETLANPGRIHPMTPETLSFAIDHFKQLSKAAEMLAELESEFLTQGALTVSKALEACRQSSAVRTAANRWANGDRALRFFPSHWQGDSQVVLVYRRDDARAVTGGLGFYLRAYIDREPVLLSLEDVEGRFRKTLDALPASWRSPTSTKCAWFERSGQLLALEVLPSDGSFRGALSALNDLTEWVERNALSGRE